MEEKYFEEIYNEYFARIYFFLHKLCHDDDLCEEMTQETFYQALISFHRFDGSCELFTWLAAIAKNTYFRYLRKNRVKFIDIDILVNERDDDERTSPERIVSKQITIQNVREALKGLPQKYYDVVVLRIYGEIPYSQIAVILKISETSAKVIFHRAKILLKERLLNEQP